MEDPILSEYKIQDCLGAGSYGVVYKALHIETNVTYAIKLIEMKKINEQPEPHREVLLRDIKREVNSLNKISAKFSNGHPNIIRLYKDLKSKETGDIYLVMEHVGGGDLEDFLKQHGPLPVSVAKRLVKQIATALQFLRTPEINIIHRDLKPKNLLVTSMDLHKAEIKVADFGLGELN
jgi:serine/threonine protein kinase